MLFLPVSSVEPTRELVRSALPDAPIIIDERRADFRARVGALLRTAARRQQRLADRIDPVRVCEPQPG